MHNFKRALTEKYIDMRKLKTKMSSILYIFKFRNFNDFSYNSILSIFIFKEILQACLAFAQCYAENAPLKLDLCYVGCKDQFQISMPSHYLERVCLTFLIFSFT